MIWRVAKCLEVLLRQINEAAPNRSKSSDGAIGDAAHASRSSDHNPWVRNGNVGIVTARDYTHDPAGGCDCNALVDSLVVSRDPRIKYIIWNKRIINSRDWIWRPYTGVNPHTHHAHVSVQSTSGLYDEEQQWSFTLPTPSGKQVAPLASPILRRGVSKGTYVKQLQTLLGIPADGIFGPNTEAAVVSYQKQQGLVADGVVGVYTWERLLP